MVGIKIESDASPMEMAPKQRRKESLGQVTLPMAKWQEDWNECQSPELMIYLCDNERSFDNPTIQGKDYVFSICKLISL